MLTRTISVDGIGARTLQLPETCPMCGCSIVPTVVRAISNDALFDNHADGISAAMACPACTNLFVVTYATKGGGINAFSNVGPQLPRNKQFDPKLSEVSPTFIDIYNQALAAETYGLSQISGMGYRKALEFLIKDYAKKLDPGESENIEKEMLSKVIQKYIDHPKIKATATASVWIGNDETHYIRKFEDKDVKDLKRLINSCVYWILADYDASDASAMISKKA